jgi:hypothetical protein
MKHKITTDAMRPASTKEKCFYCNRNIGAIHKDTCVLVKKKVKVKMEIEYEIDVPAHWTKEDIEFHRNEGSWCSLNALPELDKLTEDGSCLCGIMHFTYIPNHDSKPFLEET